MPLMLANPWVILGVVLALGASHFYAYHKGGQNAVNAVEAQAARDEKIAQVAFDNAMTATAEAISKIEVKNTTIRQVLEKEIHERPVYRTLDCSHKPDVLGMLNRALANPDGAAVAGDRLMPPTDAAAGRDVRGDDAQAGGSRRPVSPLPGRGAGAGR